MKKIVLDETQADKLMNKLVSEQITENGRYRQEVRCSFDYHNVKWGDNPDTNEIVDWIDDVKFNVSFAIDMEGKSYGIKGVTVGRVWGPEEIDVDVTVIEGDNQDTYSNITLKPNWHNVVVEYDADIRWIGIEPYIEMELIPTETQGNHLDVGKITVHAKEI